MWKAVVFSPKAAVNTFLSEYNLHIKFAFLWPGVVIENTGIGNRENEQLLLLFNNQLYLVRSLFNKEETFIIADHKILPDEVYFHKNYTGKWLHSSFTGEKPILLYGIALC